MNLFHKITTFLVLFLFPLILNAIEFPDSYKLEFNSGITQETANCGMEYYELESKNILVTKVSSGPTDATYRGEAPLTHAAFDPNTCWEGNDCTITEWLMIDGTGLYTLKIEYDSADAAYNYSVEVNFASIPEQGAHIACTDENGTYEEDITFPLWMSAFLVIHQDMASTKGFITFGDFQPETRGGEDVLARHATGSYEAFSGTSHMYIYTDPPEVVEYDPELEKNFLKDVSVENELKARVNWKGTPEESRRAWFVINGNEYEANIEGEWAKKKIDMANPKFKADLNGGGNEVVVKVSDGNNDSEYPVPNPPNIFPNWSYPSASDYQPIKNGKVVDYSFENFDNGTTIESSPGTGNTSIKLLDDHPFFQSGYWGFSGMLPIKMDDFHVYSDANEFEIEGESEVTYYGGPNVYKSNGRMANIDAKISLRKGEGLTGRFEWKHERDNPNYVFKRMLNQLFPDGYYPESGTPEILDDLGALSGGTLVKGTNFSREKFVPIIKFTGENKSEIVEINSYGYESFTSNDQLSYSGITSYMVKIYGEGYVRLRKSGNSSVATSEGLIINQLNAYVLGYWEQFARTEWPLNSSKTEKKDDISAIRGFDSAIESIDDAVVSEAEFDARPGIAVNSDNSMKAVVWQRTPSGMDRPAGEIMLRVFDENWKIPFVVSQESEYNRYPVVAFDADGMLHVAWMTSDMDPLPGSLDDMSNLINSIEITHAIINPSTGNIIMSEALTDNSKLDASPRFVRANDGSLHIFWQTTNSSFVGTENDKLSIMAASVTSAGASTPEVVTDGLTGVVSWSAAAFSGSDYAVAYAMDDSPAMIGDNPMIYIYKDGSKTGAANGNYPKIAFDDEGMIHSIWRSDSSIYAMSGTNGSPMKALELEAGMNTFARASYILSQGGASVIWRSDTRLMMSASTDPASGSWIEPMPIDSLSDYSFDYISVDKAGDGSIAIAELLVRGDLGLDADSNIVAAREYDLPSSVGVRSEIAKAPEFGIAPNPANSTAEIVLPGLNFRNIVIYDNLGNRVIEKSADSRRIRINTNGLAPGVYHCVANGPNGASSTKLLITR